MFYMPPNMPDCLYKIRQAFGEEHKNTGVVFQSFSECIFLLLRKSPITPAVFPKQEGVRDMREHAQTDRVRHERVKSR